VAEGDFCKEVGCGNDINMDEVSGKKMTLTFLSGLPNGIICSNAIYNKGDITMNSGCFLSGLPNGSVRTGSLK
jgi:hypothetical protein